MDTNIDCIENVSNSNCHQDYYVCTYNCVMAIVVMLLGICWFCGLGFYYLYERQKRPVYGNLYTDLDDEEYIDYSDDDQGLIIKGKSIDTNPPKYSQC